MQADFDKDLLTYFTDVEYLREMFKNLRHRTDANETPARHSRHRRRRQVVALAYITPALQRCARSRRASRR